MVQQPLLRILHFNDVYDIQPKAKTNTAGAYYFKAHLEKHRTQNSITLFSGDAFSPSVLSNIFRGEQMVHCLNTMAIDVSCYGNHEFDFEINHTARLASQCNFPWLLGNLIDLRTEKPLGQGKENVILERNGLKIGIFGVAEQEWLTLLTEDYQGQLQYVDFVKYSKYQVRELRHVYKCDIVIALTHMRVPNDQKLARQVPDLDFILGGHDHTIHNQVIGTTHIVKSGCNFKHFSVIDLFPKTHDTQLKGKQFNQTVQLIEITAVEDYDQQLKAYVDQKLKDYLEQNQKIVGYTLVPLQTRFSMIRRKETNYGNFLTDLIRAFYNIDAVTLQSGCIRMDAIIQPGPMKFSTISNIFDDFLVVKLVPGHTLCDLLEHSVSKYPSFEGRFMMVSGIRFTFDADLPPYARVTKQSIYVGNRSLDLGKVYKVAMTSYIGKGGDGYTFLADCKDHIDAQNATKIILLLNKFYRPPDLEQATISNDREPEPLVLKRSHSSKTERVHHFVEKIEFIDDRYVVYINPKLDGRLKIVNEVPDIQ